MHAFARWATENAYRSPDENVLLDMAMLCWLDPIIIVDLTREDQ